MTTTTKALTLGSLAALLLVGAWWLQRGPPGRQDPTTIEPLTRDEVTPDRRGGAAAPGETTPRVESTPPAGGAAAAAPELLRGRVLDARGQPAAAVPVLLATFEHGPSWIGNPLPEPEGRSDGRGEFALPWTPTQSVVPVAGEGYCTLRTTPSVRRAADADLLLVVAPARDVTGVVRGPEGVPLAKAQVSVWTFTLDEFPSPLSATVSPRNAPVTTGADGRFTLERAPIAAGIPFVFWCAGYRGRGIPSLEAASGFLDVTLQREPEAAGKVSGIVLDADGRPLEGAELRFGRLQRAKSSASGEFELTLERRPARLLATWPGSLPIVREGIDKDTPMPLRLQFSRAALSISGRVVDSEGAPLPGMLVNLVDPERADMGASVERLSAPPGPELPRGALARCDDEGRFTIGGLSERSYRLRAYDPATALAVESEPVAAGRRDVVLQVPADAFLDELRGIVVTRDGRGLPQVRVHSYLLASTVDGVATLPGPLTRTDAEGRFVLRRVPRRHVQLAVSGDDLVFTHVPVEDCLERGEVRLEVLRRCHVQVVGEAGMRIAFLDAAGKPLDVTVENLGGALGGNGWTLRAAKSPVLTVAESATTMLWLEGSKELGRKAIVLEPGKGKVTTLFTGK